MLNSEAAAGEIRSADRWLAAALGAATVLYLVSLPFGVLTPPDEAHVLHQAKRLLGGEALYRDLFDLATPLWTYLMAGLFRLFGTTLATARVAVAVMHGLAAALIFILCRRFGVRRALAAVAAAAQLVVCQPAYPVANRHWLATVLCLALLLWCASPGRGRRGSFVSGLLVGLLIATHQQRGASMGVAVLVWLVGEALLARRYGRRENAVPQALAAFAGGVLCIVVPMLAVVAQRAGVEAVWDALIVNPLTRYHGTFSAAWAQQAGGRAARTTFPLFLAWLPAVLLPIAARLSLLVWRRVDAERARLLLLLAVFCAFAPLSIAYYPDVAHIAFVAPVFFVALAEVGEITLRLLPRRWGAGVAGAAAVLFALASFAWLAQRWQHEWRGAKTERVTAFGRIPFGLATARLYDELNELLRAAPARTLYAHPFSGHLYLLLGARNPTRFEFMHPGTYHSAAQVEEVIEALRAQRVPYVVFTLPNPSDPIARFVREHYAPLPGSRQVWQRKANGGDASLPPGS